MQDKISSIFTNVYALGWSYDTAINQIWDQTSSIHDVVREVFGSKENLYRFYSIVKDFNYWQTDDITEARHIVNEVLLADLLNIDPASVNTSAIIERIAREVRFSY